MTERMDTQTDVTTEAADWLGVMIGAETTDEERRALIEWLCRDPEHVGQMLETYALHVEASQVARRHANGTLRDFIRTLQLNSGDTLRVLTLRKVYGLTPTHIAAHLHLAQNVVETHLSTAALCCARSFEEIDDRVDSSARGSDVAPS